MKELVFPPKELGQGVLLGGMWDNKFLAHGNHYSDAWGEADIQQTAGQLVNDDEVVDK